MTPRKTAEPAFNAAALKREFPGLAERGLHHLDNAATAQVPEVVLSTLRRFEIDARANVHEGVHRRARAATAALAQAPERVMRFLHAGSADEVVFTYGATSSINLLANSFGASLKAGDEIMLSVLEHHSNLVPWQMLAARRGVTLRFLPMTEEGRLDLDRLDNELTGRCRLVALTHCSNVTGALTDVSRVVKAARTVGAKIMLDGAQRAPHGPLTFAGSISTSMPSQATRPTGRRVSACSGAGANCSKTCRRFSPAGR
jgi:cysteine desulfurase/selenocysteine lyase